MFFFNQRLNRLLYYMLSEKARATHCSTLAWKIPRTQEPGGLRSMGSLGVGHDWSDLAAAAAAEFSRRRQWQPTAVLLPGKSHGRWSLVGCSPLSRKESDMSEHWTELKYLEKFKVIGLQDLFKLPSTTLLLKLHIYNMTHITHFWTK